ncbi:hypothetical protein Aduo_015787 [Ancylostoma duodenale]
MNLRDYLSNCPFVNDNIPAPDRASSNVAKVFGIQWNSDHDELALECSAKMHKRATKRSVLSQIIGLCFDPLGLLTPLLTKGKTFLQDLHKKKLGWDDPLPDEDSETWTSIRQDMIDFTVSVPRRVTQRQGCTKQTLSVFVDSSKRVYACVAYITTETEEGRYTRLYCAKSKQTDRTQTIPKLELLAIFTGMNMTEYIITKSGLKYDKVNIFSDSTIVLAWIHSKKRLPSLVTKLTQKIQMSRERIASIQKIRFYHVPTEENVAVHATGGLSREAARNHAWFKGLEWLNSTESNWPVSTFEELTQTDEDECYAFLNTIEETNKIAHEKARIWPTEKIISYDKIKRIVAYSLRFVRNISRSRIASIDCCETFDLIPNA